MNQPETSICCDSPITSLGLCGDCSEPTGPAPAEWSEDEESDKAVNAMLNRAAAYMALAIVAGYVAGVVIWPVLTR